jgi:hypothetical protein
MYSATTYVIRDIRDDDVPELMRLGWAASGWPEGRILVGEIHGAVAAALAIDEDRLLVTSAPGVPALLAHMRARTAGIKAYDRTPDVADRIRERMGRRVIVGV